jgi:hypothetical protein
MTEAQEPQAPPLAIDTAECSPAERDTVIVRVSGRWRGRRHGDENRAVLLVESDGRSHRFHPVPEPRRHRLGRSDGFGASFVLPASLVPALMGDLSLWLGDDVVALPEVVFTGDRRAPAPPPDVVEEPVAVPAALGDADTVAALRAELQARAASEAHLRGELAAVQAQLRARSSGSPRLEQALTELRDELERLRKLVDEEGSVRADIESKAMVMAARVHELEDELASAVAARDRVAGEIADIRTELAHSIVAREAAAGEAAGLRAEIDRMGGELATAREEVGSRDSGLSEAEALLAEARGLTEKLGRRRDSVAGEAANAP